MPKVENYEIEEDVDNEKMYLSFDLVDPDKSVKSMSATIYNENQEIIEKKNIETLNRIEVDAQKGKTYKIVVDLVYNLASEEIQIDEYSGIISIEKEVELNIDYNLSVSNIKTYKDTNELSVFQKEDEITIGFNITNSTKFEPQKVKINGIEYEVKKQGEQYIVKIENKFDIGNHTIKLEEILLSNGKRITLEESNEISIEVIKRKPTVNNFNSTEDIHNKTMNISFNLTDKDKTLQSLDIILLNDQNKEISKQSLTKIELERNEISKVLNTETTSKYKVKFIAKYVQKEEVIEDVIFEKEIAAETQINIIKGTSNKTYYEKGEKVVLTYEISTNKKEEIKQIRVNNTDCTVTKLTDGKYSINAYTQNTSGVENLTVSKIIFEDNKEVVANYVTSIEVLKDIPISEDFTQIDDVENTSITLTANIIDPDDAFISGIAELYIRNDDDSLGEIIATKKLEKGNITFTINEEDGLKLDEKYMLITKITYDRDTNTIEEEENQNYVQNKEFSRRHIQLIANYNIQISNLKTFNKENETHYFEKGQYATISFDSTNNTEFYPIKATINGTQYDLQKQGNNYKTDILLDSTSGVKDIVIEKITLSNTVQIELKDKSKTNIEILKNKPSAHELTYKENDDSTITAKFVVMDEEKSIKSGSIIITDEHGKQLKTQDLKDNENEITFSKNTSEYYTIKIIANYDLDTNHFDNNSNLYSSQVLLETPINLGERFLEMKNILGITLYEQKENGVEKVSSLNVNDLNNLDKYIVQVNMKEERNFYTTIKEYDIIDEQLKFVLDYDKVVQYNGNSKSNQLELVYGSVDSGIATNIDVETLLGLIEKNPAGNYKVNMDFDAKNITARTAIIPQDFTGTIDFQGHTIKNMSIPLFNNLSNATIENLVITDSSARANGLFANTINNSTIKNVHIENVTVTATNANGTGTFAGQTTDCTFENISATEVNIGNAKRTGGLIGKMYSSTIKNGYITGTINSTNDAAGGVIGEAFSNSVIENFYANIMTNYSWTGGSIGGFIGNPEGITLTNCISLAQAVTEGHGARVYGSYNNSKISNSSKGVYELSTSNMTPNEGKQGIKVVTPETLKTKQFYTETLGWSEENWDLSKVASGSYPTLKSYNSTENEDIYIPDFSRIKELSYYDDEHKIAYHNMYKLMPFYDAKYYVEDGNKLETTHILNTKIIKEIFAYDANGKQVVALSNNDKNKINTIRIVFTDDETINYNVIFKNSLDRVAIYNISDINIDYMYDKYLIDTNSKVYTYILDKVKNLDYVNNIASLTTETEVRNYTENYSHVKENAEKFALNLLANMEEYSISSSNEILENKIIQELSNNHTMEKLLYGYNYFDRFYNIEIGGINITDIVYFDGSIFSDKLNPLSVSLALVDSASETERSTENLTTYFNKYIKPLTNDLTVGPFLEYFMKNLTTEKYKNDPGSWIVDNYEGTVYEAPAQRYPEIRYRVWDHLKARDLLILPILSYHGDDLYVLGIPTCVMVGNLDDEYYLKNGFNKTQFSDVTKQERVNYLKSFADKATKFYDSIAGIVRTTNGYANMKDRTMINYDSTSNKNWSNDEDVKEIYKRFFEVLNKYTVHNAASAYANGTDIYWTYDALAFYSIFTHEAIHNQDGNTFLEGTGRRDGANAEYFTDGFLTQSPGTYGVVPNYTYDFSLDQDIATNLTTDRINTREKIEDYYSKMFDVFAALDYIEAQAFLQLTPEEQSQVAYIIEESEGSNTSISYVRKTAEEFRKMKLEKIEDLWDNKIVITRGETSLVGGTDWYVVHNDDGLVNKNRFILVAYQMLADFGYDGYTAYAGYTYKTDLEALKAASGNPNITWREYQLERYKKIAAKLENTIYFNKEELIKDIKARMENDISNGVQNSNSSSVAMLRKTIYGHIKRVTNDFVEEIFTNNQVNKIHVKTAQDFRKLLEEKPNGEFVLDTDIDVSKITDGNAIIREPFYGTLDGNGHKIIGNKIPLFAKLNYANVTNLNIEETNISQTDIYCGALAKVVVNSNITNVTGKNINISATVNEIGALIGNASRTYMNNTHVTSANVSGAGRVGVLVGYGNYMTVENCSSNGIVTATAGAIGGFFGQFDNSSVHDSYSLGSIRGRIDVGGFIGWSEGTTTIKNCYSRVNVETTGGTGGGFIGQIRDTGRIENCIALGNGTSSYKFDGRSGNAMFNNFKNNYELEEAIGTSTLSKADIDFNNKITVVKIQELTETFYKEKLGFDQKIWDLSKVTTGGLPKLVSSLDTNEVEDVIERTKISTVEEFLKLNENPSALYLLTSDLDFKDYTGENKSVISTTFTGGIYGNGHTIKNLNGYTLFANFRGRVQDLNIENFTNIRERENSVAAFAQETFTATLKNMKFKNITLSGANNVAVVTGMDGRNNANSVFENISVKNADVTGTGVYVSTFAGRKFGGLIRNVYVQGTIKINSTENGGLVGAIEQTVTIENVITDVDITKTHNTYSPVEKSEFNGSMIGNIYNTPKISNCIAFGNMTGFTDDSGASKVPYKFTGALENQIIDYLNKCYEVQEEVGTSRVTAATKGKLDEISKSSLDTAFYEKLGFDKTIWDYTKISENGYPELK